MLDLTLFSKKKDKRMIYEAEDISLFILNTTKELQCCNWNKLNEEQRFNTLMGLEPSFFAEALYCFDGTSPVLFQFSDENKIQLLNRLANTYPTQMRKIILKKNAYRETLFDFIDPQNQPKVSNIIQIAADNSRDIRIKVAARKAKERS